MVTDERDGDQNAVGVENDVAGRGAVIVFSGDLFFGMRIRTALQESGYTVVLAPDAAMFQTRLASGEPMAVLGLVDFNRTVDWTALQPALDSGVPIVAFGPHKDVDGFRAARAAGVTRVVSNGEFSRSLPQLVERYASPANGETRPAPE